MTNEQIGELKHFIWQASRATYASGDESIKEKQLDGSTTIRFETGDFAFHDNYFGGEPYGGREVVFLNQKPVWMMVYYGFVEPGQVNKQVYTILMAALSQAPAEAPYRGPSHFEQGEWRYENSLTGTIERFSGEEKIFQNDVCVYQANYLGGLVDL